MKNEVNEENLNLFIDKKIGIFYEASSFEFEIKEGFRYFLSITFHIFDEITYDFIRLDFDKNLKLIMFDLDPDGAYLTAEDIGEDLLLSILKFCNELREYFKEDL